MGRLINLKGKKFGRLTVLGKKKDGTYINGEALWECKCSCSKQTIINVHGSQLRRGDKKSCGCLRKPDEEENLKRLQLRLMEKTVLNPVTQCWNWTGKKNRNGYGYISFTINGIERAIGTHRAAWLIYKGKIPFGMCVLHRCDNPACVSIYHLFLGTQEDNVADKMKKGRHVVRRGSERSNAKINEKKALKILGLKNVMTSAEVGKKYGIVPSSVRAIWQRRSWKHVKPPKQKEEKK